MATKKSTNSKGAGSKFVLAANVKRIRLEKGLKAIELSRKAGLGDTYISLVERAKQKNPSLWALDQIARVLHVPTAELLLDHGAIEHEVAINSIIRLLEDLKDWDKRTKR